MAKIECDDYIVRPCKGADPVGALQVIIRQGGVQYWS